MTPGHQRGSHRRSHRRPTRLTVGVVDARGRKVVAPGLSRWLAVVASSRAAGNVTVALVSDERIRRLNRVYRGVDRPTDVLSFPTSTDERRADRDHAFLGDIVIAKGVAARQARVAQHDTATELKILALHGLLHLLGYDHEGDGGRMARVEGRLRRRGHLREGLIERTRGTGGVGVSATS